MLIKKDWAECTVLLQPLARQLNEAMNRREYDEAHILALRLMGVAHTLGAYAEELKAPENFQG